MVGLGEALETLSKFQACMGRGFHGLPKVSLGPPCPTLLRPALRLFRGWPAAVFYPFGYPTPYGPAKFYLIFDTFRPTVCYNE